MTVNPKHALHTVGLWLGLWLIPATAAEPPVTAVAFAPNAKTVVACSQAGVRVYSWPELKHQATFRAAAVNLHDIAFSPSGNRLAVGGGTPTEDGSVEIFSWPAGKSLKVLGGQSNLVMGLTWLSEASLAAASLDHSVTLWNPRTGALQRRLEGHSRGSVRCAFCRRRKSLSARVWTGA